MSAIAVNRLPASLLVHTAVPVTYDEGTPVEWIEGESGPAAGGEAVEGVEFPCVLFLPGPGGQQDNPYRQRVVRTPQIMFNPLRADLTTVVLGKSSEVLVTAPDLAAYTGANTVRWLLQGDAQPFGPPGTVYGLLALLTRVED